MRIADAAKSLLARGNARSRVAALPATPLDRTLRGGAAAGSRSLGGPAAKPSGTDDRPPIPGGDPVDEAMSPAGRDHRLEADHSWLLDS